MKRIAKKIMFSTMVCATVTLTTSFVKINAQEINRNTLNSYETNMEAVENEINIRTLSNNETTQTWDVSEAQDGTVTATLTSDGTLTISGTGQMKNYSSGKQPYYNQKDDIKNVVIEKGVTSIGDSAFEYCRSLTSIEIPEGVTSIGYNSFFDCRSLTSIKIPEGVTRIGYVAFWGCSSLTSIEIPESVTSIGENAFDYCGSLISIEVNENNRNYCSSENGVLFNKEKTSLIKYPAQKVDTKYAIPNSVTSIKKSAFRECSGLISIEIPDSVTSIGNDAFVGCSNLTSIEIPKGVTSIEENTFEGCSSLTSIEIPNGVTNIEYAAFRNCSNLTSIEIPESVTSIVCVAFDGCSSLTSIDVNENNKNYCSENGVLFNKEKTSLIKYSAKKVDTKYAIPNSVTSIGMRAFEYCSRLTSIEIPNSVTSIGEKAFLECSSLTSIEIPNGVTSIGYAVFRNCSNLTSIEIPESVTSIGMEAFEDCRSLTNIEIPKGVTSIGYRAFWGCRNLIINTVCNNEKVKEYAKTNNIKINLTHIAGEAKEENRIEATCTEDGSYDEVKYCVGCQKEMSREKKTIKALGHDYKETVIQPTETEQGYTLHTCKRCKEEYKDNYIPAKGNRAEIIFKNLTTVQVNENKYVKISNTLLPNNLTEQMDKTALKDKMPEYKNLTENGKLKTGSEITLDGDIQYIVIVMGDINCDGEISPIDVTMANSIRLGKATASDVQILAADFDSKDGIKPIDITMINSYRLGKITISI